jgi:energy-coupling factor transporter ATP-binding protein EcfA2
MMSISLLINGILVLVGPIIFVALYIATDDLRFAMLYTVIYALFLGGYRLLTLVSNYLVDRWENSMEEFIDKTRERISDVEWQDRMGDIVDRATPTRFSLFTLTYHQTLDAWYGHLAMRAPGIHHLHDIRLEQVFVQPRLQLQTLTEADIEQLAEEARDVAHRSIWYFLQQNRSYVILGESGAGKTTLLQSIALTMGDRRERQRLNIPYFLPILLLMRDILPYTSELDATHRIPPLTDILHKRLAAADKEPPEQWVNDFLERERALIMIDGLDKVESEEQRVQVIRWLREQIATYGGNRFLVTSRPAGYRQEQIEDLTVLDLYEFDTRQQRQFAYNWFLVNALREETEDERIAAPDRSVRKARQEAKSQAKNLTYTIQRNANLRPLATKPLLLTMLAILFQKYQALPRYRTQIIGEMVKIYLGKGWKSSNQHAAQLTPTQKQDLLMALAYGAMEQEYLDISLPIADDTLAPLLEQLPQSLRTKTFLDMIAETSGLLIRTATGAYQFTHIYFQEYLAAAYIARKPDLLLSLEWNISNRWWYDTTVMYCGITDATPVIKACIDALDQRHDVLYNTPLLLGVNCLEETQAVDQFVADQFQTIIDQGVDADDERTRQFFRESKLQLRLAGIPRVADGAYVDTSLITQAEYQVFIDEMATDTHEVHPDHWRRPHYETGQGNQPILGVRPEDAVDFCKWLNEKDEDNRRFRLPTPDEAQTVTPDFRYWVMKANGKFDVPSPANMPRHRKHTPVNLIGIVDELTEISQRTLVDFQRVDMQVRLKNRATEIARLSSRDFALDIDNATQMARTLFRDVDLVRRLEEARVQAVNTNRDPLKDIALVRQLAHAIDLVRTNIRLKTQILPADENIEQLNDNLARARERYLAFERNIADAEDIARKADTASQRAINAATASIITDTLALDDALDTAFMHTLSYVRVTKQLRDTLSVSELARDIARELSRAGNATMAFYFMSFILLLNVFTSYSILALIELEERPTRRYQWSKYWQVQGVKILMSFKMVQFALEVTGSNESVRNIYQREIEEIEETIALVHDLLSAAERISKRQKGEEAPFEGILIVYDPLTRIHLS